MNVANINCPYCKKVTLAGFEKCMSCNELINPIKICEQCGKSNMTSQNLCITCYSVDPVLMKYKKRMNTATYSKL